MIDYSRQYELFDPNSFNTPVHIIGVGAVGSWVTMYLAKLGVKNITVYDPDTVSLHNIPNQTYSIRDEGAEKVVALQDDINYFTGTEIRIHQYAVTGQQELSGIVIICVDSMKDRKLIWENCLKLRVAVKLVIECRMGMDLGRIYSIIPCTVKHIFSYEKSLHTDDEAEVSVCGSSQSIITTAAMVASIASRQVIDFHNNKNLFNEINIDVENNLFYNLRW